MAADVLTEDELELYQPKSADERRLRALFYSTQTARHSLHLLRKCLDHFDAAATNGRKSSPPTTLEHQTTLKLLTTLEMWMALRMQSDVARSDWLVEFFRDAWAQADMLNPQPGAVKTLEQFPSGRMDYRSYCELVATRLCHDLHLGEQAADALLFVTKVLEDGAESRAQILRQAVTTPTVNLKRLVEAGAPV